eukprot:Sspe_Gene.75973::Locus_47470_Transcript_1_1_Confidence_1.000_Length_2855::g.75973::m.75973/K12400/AP4E1; AP-4 complex subunit epsilon-1
MSKFSRAKTGREMNNSRQFFELIRAIGEAKSKQEEDKIIAREIVVLKTKMKEKDVDERQMKEYVVRLLYCEMLGHPAEFGYFHCVGLIASNDLLHKRTGYLACQLTMSPASEFMYLIIAPMQKDLKSSNTLAVCAALNAATKLANEELMSCVFDDVVACLKHTVPLVRKKAIVCIHAFWKRNEMGVGDVKSYQQVLCDPDPSVMAACLCFLHDLCCLDPEDNKHLVPSFVQILKQICNNNLTKDYDYNRVPAPWIQIKLLKLLAILCHMDPEKSAYAYEVLGEVMKRADSGFNIGTAVVFECVKTITCLYHNEGLIEAAADAISKFLKSPSPNLQYLGITALSRIVLINPRYAVDHQQIVIDCLEDHDETIRRKTLDLLYAMTNENNVEVIVARLIKYLSAAHDNFLKADLVHNICDLSVRFFRTMEWYIQTMNQVIQLGEAHIDTQTVQSMLKMIAEGSEEEEEDVNEKFRLFAVYLYYDILDNDDNQKLPETLIQIIAWVLGEYGYMSEKHSKEEIINKLCDLLEKSHDDLDTRGWIITALMKITAQLGNVPKHVIDLVSTFKQSQSLPLQQRCYEFLELAKHTQLMAHVLPEDGCCLDLEVDPELSFLNAVVKQALASGMKDHRKKEDDFAARETKDTRLKTQAYQNPNQGPVLEDEAPDVEEEIKLVVNSTNKKWTREMLEPQKPDDAPVPTMMEPDDEMEDSPRGADIPQHMEEPAQPVGKQKLTEKEKLARDIFGGLTGAPAKKKVDKAQKAAKKAEKERKKAEKEAKKMAASSTSSDPQQPPSPTMPQPALQQPAAQPARKSPSPVHPSNDFDALFAAPSSPTRPAHTLTPISAAELPTDKFGQAWQAHGHETEVAIPIPPQSAGIGIEGVAQKALQNANIGKVQTIGQEFIAGAKEPTSLVLCHVRMAGGRVIIKVRTSQPALSQSI